MQLSSLPARNGNVNSTFFPLQELFLWLDLELVRRPNCQQRPIDQIARLLYRSEHSGGGKRGYEGGPRNCSNSDKLNKSPGTRARLWHESVYVM